MKRRHPPLDIMNMYSTLTLDHWRSCLEKAVNSCNINKLIAWRYGIQAGLSDAAAKGVTTEKIDLWAIKRCRDLEKCARFILKKMYKNPQDNPSLDRIGYVQKAIEAKKKRDKAFEVFLMKSNF